MPEWKDVTDQTISLSVHSFDCPGGYVMVRRTKRENWHIWFRLEGSEDLEAGAPPLVEAVNIAIEKAEAFLIALKTHRAFHPEG